jgi:hypothetical protein
MSEFKEHLPSWLCMLTHHFYTLSKPVNPIGGLLIASVSVYPESDLLSR